MLFDDDDNPAASLAAPSSQLPEVSEEAPTVGETLEEEEVQDFRLFASLRSKKNVSAQSIRKGEKDFESHGTRSQDSALEQSRQVMEEVLSYTRHHTAK